MLPMRKTISAFKKDYLFFCGSSLHESFSYFGRYAHFSLIHFFSALDRTHTILVVFSDLSHCFLMTLLSMPVDFEVLGGLAGWLAFRLDF